MPKSSSLPQDLTLRNSNSFIPFSWPHPGPFFFSAKSYLAPKVTSWTEILKYRCVEEMSWSFSCLFSPHLLYPQEYAPPLGLVMYDPSNPSLVTLVKRLKKNRTSSFSTPLFSPFQDWESPLSWLLGRTLWYHLYSDLPKKSGVNIQD